MSSKIIFKDCIITLFAILQQKHYLSGVIDPVRKYLKQYRVELCVTQITQISDFQLVAINDGWYWYNYASALFNASNMGIVAFLNCKTDEIMRRLWHTADKSVVCVDPQMLSQKHYQQYKYCWHNISYFLNLK